jgi:7-keto-8-aminopelargonate synthetase-like enzyme
MFSTAQPAATAAAARAGIAIINSEEGEQRAQQLWENILFAQQAIGGVAAQCKELEAPSSAPPSSAIFPLIVYQEEQALALAEQLYELGFYIPAIRYPTVARGRARLRMTLSSAHPRDAIEQLIEAIRKTFFYSLHTTYGESRFEKVTV